jgi:glycosyltransferase 2 family protein
MNVSSSSKKAIWRAMSIGITVAAVVWLAFTVNWSAAGATLLRAERSWLFAAFLVFVFNYLLRSLRFRILSAPARIPLPKLMSVTCLYGMYNYLLPARLGEMSFIVLARTRLDVSIPRGAGVLLAARFFDFASVALFLPLVLLLMWDKLDSWIVAPSIAYVLTFIFLTAVFYAYFRIRGGKPEQNAEDRPGLIGLPYRLLHSFMQNLTEVIHTAHHWRVMFLSMAIWLCVYANFYLIIRGLGFSPSLPLVVVLSIIMVPLTLLPLQGFANLGTHELGWVAGLALFGFSRDSALEIAVGSHFVLLVFVLLLGLIGLGLVRTSTIRSVRS